MNDQFGFLITDAPPPTPVPLFCLRRTIAPGIVEHFYTVFAEERDRAMNHFGFEHAGVISAVFDRPAPDTVPLFRLWHTPSRRHSFTTRPDNLAAALATGAYRHEGVAAYVFDTDQQPGTVPLYALAYWVSNIHLYTTDPAERDSAVATGAELLGIACWVYPAAADRIGR